jgi:hypothetical protein
LVSTRPKNERDLAMDMETSLEGAREMRVPSRFLFRGRARNCRTPRVREPAAL